MEGLEISKSLVERAYEVILDALCDGTFKPGERLTQEDIAARLKVSRQPVTHALVLLKSQGFLEPVGRRGLTVTAIEPEFIEALFQLRAAIEPLAVTLATSRLTKASIARGRALIKHGRRVVRDGDSKAILQADMDFHSFIYELSGNPLIADTMRLHWHHLRRAMSQVLRSPAMQMAVWTEHANILENMIAGHADKAAEAMRRHLVDASERTRKSGLSAF
ncbi:GntR family transcriptional regulator [Hyphomicrobium sp.]|uniref:GntR family transcriptional regulator n=1 Tax=Hyphomicrobium sp. TaxID=82 RepID=UPI0025B95F77|nr:GntR family transcriptional regulator [Hyphomicrobium sp.]MCC7253277.1 GntR family transcriptional regulator [Hyphomicrobium sp.]